MFAERPEIIQACSVREKEYLNVIWIITGSCNLDCLHCHGLHRGHSSRELGTDGVLAIAERLISEPELQRISITGGEPFMRNDLGQILAHIAEQRRIPIDITTNAHLITSTIAKELPQIGLDQAYVGLDSFDATAYDSFRQSPGGLTKAIRGISHLIEAGVPVSLVSTVTQFNYTSLNAVVDHASMLGVKEVVFTGLFNLGMANDNAHVLELDSQQHE